MQLTPYHAKYLAFDLTRSYPADDYGKLTASLQDAQVDLNPHQVEAALFAFRSPLSMGAILADEVGLGKTIEAGIILSQKWAERKRKLLVIAPASLRKQWSQELADKFFLPSVVMDGEAFKQLEKGGQTNPLDQTDRIVICSYPFARRYEKFLRGVRWDLAVIDEAHRLRNVYRADNKTGHAIKKALKLVPKVLLTATPLQNSLLELYGMVSLIDEYVFGDLKSFKAQYARLADEGRFQELKQRLGPVVKRTLRRQVMEYIRYTQRFSIREPYTPTAQEQELYDLVSDYLRRSELYALPVSQRKLMTLVLRKLLASSSFAIARTLRTLADKLDALLAEESDLDDEADLRSNFEAYGNLQDEWAEADEIEEAPGFYADSRLQAIAAERDDLRRYQRLAESIRENSKGRKLFTALEKGFEAMAERGAAQKALLFTESRATQRYLYDLLSEGGYSGRIVLFNGTNDDPEARRIYRAWKARHADTDRISGARSADTRAALVEYFRDEADIMIATEAAAEGINLQFCSLVINYDMPWNPQRIEQRIGRCHRYGQQHDVVVINFLNQANEADVRVYELLDEKFQLFNGVFGASDEVIGTIGSGVDFEKRIAEIYQSCRHPEEIQRAFDALQRELEDEIQARLASTRQQLLENLDEEVREKLRISEEKNRAYLNAYEKKLWDLTRYFLRDHAEFEEEGYGFRLRSNPFAEEHIYPGPYRMGKGVHDANLYRSQHPLAQRIIAACKAQALPSHQVTFDYSGTQTRISLLEPLIGQQGWLRVVNYRIETPTETEDHLLISLHSDAGQQLPPEVAARFFSLAAQVGGEAPLPPQAVEQALQQDLARQEATYFDDYLQRSADLMQEQIDKLDQWAEDMKQGLEKEIEDLDKEIRLRKTEARKLIDLETKVKAQRLVKDLEKRRKEKQRHLFDAQDQIEDEKDQLLNDIETRLQKHTARQELFTLRWQMV